MLELLLLVCLAAQPDRCEEIYMRTEGPTDMMQCLFNGQKQAIKWREEHPGYVVRKWRCGEPRA
jgi:hypothetical protein